MPARPIPYLKAWVAYLIWSVVFCGFAGVVIGLIVAGVATAAGEGVKEELVKVVGNVTVIAASLPLSYLSFKFAVQQYIIPAAHAQAQPAPHDMINLQSGESMCSHGFVCKAG